MTEDAAPAPGRRRIPKPLAWLFKFAIAALAIYLVAGKVPFQSVGPTLRHCDFRLIALSTFLLYLAAVANAFRWKILFPRPDLPLHKYLYFVLLGQFFNLFFPTSVAAEAVKVLAFGRKYGSMQENIGVALLSKGVGMLMQVAMAAVGLLLYYRELADHGLFAKAHLDQRALFAMAGAAVLALGLAWAFRHRLKTQTWFRTMFDIARDRKLLARMLFWTAVIQLLAAASSYCIFMSLYPETRFWQVVLFTTIILGVLMLPFGFGGVGVREYLNLLLFTDVGGIPASITFAVNVVGYLPLILMAATGGAWMAFRKSRE